MDQGAATAMTPQGGRTPTGLPTSNPAMCPQGDYVLKFKTFSRLGYSRKNPHPILNVYSRITPPKIKELIKENHL